MQEPRVDRQRASWLSEASVLVQSMPYHRQLSPQPSLSPPAFSLPPSLASGSHPPILPSSHHLFPVGLPPLASLAAHLLIVSSSSISAGEGTKKQREPTDEGEGCLPLASHSSHSCHSCHCYYYYLIIISQAVSFHDLHCPFSLSSYPLFHTSPLGCLRLTVTMVF